MSTKENKIFFFDSKNEKFVNESGDQIKKIDLKKKYDDDILVSLLNYIECEAHRELLLKGLE